ncbi:MAG: mechanosensitive ion channel domain-containing protein, partial [Alphaproteobacteria bacterium]
PLMASTAIAAPASAPSAAPSPVPVTHEAPVAPIASAVSIEDLTSLVSTLEDERARAELVKHLKTLLAARAAPHENEEQAGGALLAFLSEAIGNAGADMSATWATLGLASRTLVQAWTKLAAFEVTRAGAFHLGKIVLLFAAALLAQWASRRLLRGPLGALAARAPESVVMRVPLLLFHAVLDALPIGTFAIAAFAALPLVELPRASRLAAFVLINAHIVIGLSLVAARFVLAPKASALRILPAGDGTIAYAYRWVRRFLCVGIYGYMLSSAMPLFGLPRPLDRVALDIVGLAVAVMAAAVVVQSRAQVAKWIRGEAESGSMVRMRAVLAGLWHVIALGYFAIAYVIWMAGLKGAFGGFTRGSAWTAAILAAAAILIAVAGRLLGMTKLARDGRSARPPHSDVRVQRYRSAGMAVVRAAIFSAAAIAILEAWQFGALKALGSDLGREAAASLATILGVVFAAFFVWEAVGAAMDRRLANARSASQQGKYRTAFPILKRFLFLALAVMVGFTLLSEFGVNIAPLLAGAGVIGIAVGLGAQNMAKDVLKGLTILLEDSIAVGDWITVAGRTGEVEQLSIGSVRLRDLNGNVHIVPFSEVSTVVNMNREFGYGVIEVGVSYRDDIDRAIEVVEAVVAEMRADETLGKGILGGLEMLGVAALAESAVTIRGRVKTGPLLQWKVEREFRRRIKVRFDELGFEFPYPQRAVHLVAAPASLTERSP